MLINNILQKGRGAVATVGAEAKVAEAAALLAAQRIDVVVVCDAEQKILGVLTARDIMRDFASCKGSMYVCNTPVSKVMAHQVTTCSPNDDLGDVRALMVERGLRRIPIVDDDGRFIGLVSLREILLHQYEKAKFEEEELEHYYFGVGYR
jgi:CBS domain-containing protein